MEETDWSPEMEKDLLKRYIAETVKIGPAYAKKEELKNTIQSLVEEAVASGQVYTPEELSDWWSTVDMAVLALKNVPINVWRRKMGV